MRDKFIVEDENEFIKIVRAELERKIQLLIKRGIRAVRSRGFIVDVISLSGEKLPKKEKLEIFCLAERILELQKREKELRGKRK